MRVLLTFKFGVFLATAVCLSIVVLIVSASADDSELKERVVLMSSGRVLTGFASRNAGGWLVEQSNGRVQIPLDDVGFVADSLVDAYRQQRDSVVEPTPATHMALAQWCISYRLHGEARDELRKCLKLDPEHSAARKLLRRLDDILDPASVKSAPKDVVPRRTADGFLVPDAESLGGLSNETAAMFIQRVQPLLVNKCGNASCHGTTTPGQKSEGFHLIPVRLGSNTHRLYAERNLAEVMRFIDVQEPEQSPLLGVPQGNHGGTAGVFHGAGGSAQIKTLRAWIKVVVEERRVEDEEFKVRAKLPTKGRRPAPETPTASVAWDGELNHSPATASVDGETNSNSTPANRIRKTLNSKSDFTASHSLAESKLASRPVRDTKSKVSGGDDDRPSEDPFDPDVFNRRFHASPPR